MGRQVRLLERVRMNAASVRPERLTAATPADIERMDNKCAVSCASSVNTPPLLTSSQRPSPATLYNRLFTHYVYQDLICAECTDQSCRNS